MYKGILFNLLNLWTMKRNYNQPEVLVAQFASMTLMQAASPAPTQTGIPIGNGDTDTQW